MVTSRGSSGQVVVSLVGILALVGSGLAALLGFGATAQSVSLRDGAVWVQSLTGALHLLDTGSALIGYTLRTAAAGRSLEIVNDGTTTVLRDRLTGEIHSIDMTGAIARLNGPAQLTRDAYLLAGAGRTYVLRADEGEVAALDPVTLAIGAPVGVGGSMGTAAVDKSGTLWVAVPGLGAVVPVTAARGVATLGDRAIVGPPGTRAEVTVSAGVPYGLVESDGRLLRLRAGGVDEVARVPAGVRVAASQGDPEDGHVVLGQPNGSVLRVDPRTGRTATYDLPGRKGNELDPPVQSRTQIVVPDRTTGELVLIDPASGEVTTVQARQGPGEIPLTVADGAVVANDPASSNAVVVMRTGGHREVNKSGPAPENDPAAELAQGQPGPGTPQPGGAPSLEQPSGERREGAVSSQNPQAGAPQSVGASPAAGGVTPQDTQAGVSQAPGVPPVGPQTGTAPGSTTVPTQAPPATLPPPAASQPPGDPVNPRSAGGTGQVVLSWQPAPTGGPPARFLIKGPGVNTEAAPGERSATVPATGGAPATFTIQAVNTAGSSKEVPFPPATAQPQAPGPPTAARAVPGDRQIVVSWAPSAANGATIQGYRVVAGNGVSVEVEGTTTSARLAPLTNGSDYAPITITALTDRPDVISQPATIAAPAVPFGKPLAPTGLAVTGGDRSATVTFSAADANGDPVTGYDLIASPGDQTVHVPSDGPLRGTLTGLTNGTLYTITATATNTAGTSPQSRPVSVTPRGRAVPISDTFDSGAGGWDVVNKAQLAYEPTGGNGGGYVSGTDIPDVCCTWYFEAPSRYKGDKSAYVGTVLRFDLKQSTLENPISGFKGYVWLIASDGTTLFYDSGSHPGTDWTSYQVRMDGGAGWQNTTAGRAATPEDMRTVMGDLLYLRIRGEFSGSTVPDVGGLDNVTLGA